MREVVYVTEPEVINLQEVRELLPVGYELVPGDTSFTGTIPEDCTTLLIRSVTEIKPSIKETFPNIRSIIRIGTGLDNIDLNFCAQEGIHVFSSPGANADAASDYIICMMLVALRKIATLHPDDVSTWNRFKFTGSSVSNQTIGIIGFGNIGKLVHKKLQGFSCKEFYVYDPYVHEDSLPSDVTSVDSVDAVMASSSIVTLHLPLLPETYHLIDSNNLKLLPENSILINASRGGIVDEADVIAFARDRGLVYVADTVENEPEVNPMLLQEKNVIITPHIASLTKESESNMIQVAIENYLSHNSVYLKGASLVG